MSTERLDVVSFKQTKSGKWFAVRLGSATPDQKGTGWNLYLDAMPAPVDGQYRLSVVPQRDREDAPAQTGPQGSLPRRSGPLDDDIPFAPCVD